MTDEKNHHQQPQHYRPDAAWPAYPPDDEISLFDLWAVLIRRKWWIVGVTVLVVALALGYALVRERSYEYKSVIEIGTRPVDGGVRPIEPVSTAQAKLANTYIPLTIAEWFERQGVPEEQEWNLEVSASIPEGSDIIVLSGKGATVRAEAYRTVVEEAIQRLKSEHDQITDQLRARLELYIKIAKQRADSIAGTIDRLEVEGKQMAERASLLSGEIEQIKNILSGDQPKDGADTASLAGSSTASLLMMSNLVNIPARLEQINREIGQKQDELQAQRERVQVLETRLDNVRATHALSEPQQSREPTGTGNRLIVLLALVLGGMLGVFAAFFAEFVSRANEHMRAQ